MIRVDSKELSVYYVMDNDNLAFKSSAEFVSVSLLNETAIHKEMRLPPSLHSIIIGKCHGKIIKLWLILMSKTTAEARQIRGVDVEFNNNQLDQ